MDWDEALRGLLTALAIGLLIGVVRERTHLTTVSKAGTRTHALIAVLGAVTWGLGPGPFSASLVVVGALAVIGYLKTANTDPGMTGEIAIVLTFVLGGLARGQGVIASALGVVVAILLYVKKPLQHFTRDLISDHELEDVLMLCAAAVVVWPLLPQQPIDPWGLLDFNTVWRLVVLVMAVGMLGHIAQRAAGIKLGLPLAGFFAGFVSSTLAVASFGQQAKAAPMMMTVASAGALLANLASLFLMAAVIGAASPDLLREMIVVLLVSAGVLMVTALLCLSQQSHPNVWSETVSARAFKLTHAIAIAVIISTVIILTAWLREHFGDTSALITAGIAALVELQAAAASIAQLRSTGALDPKLAQWGILIVMASASIAKALLAFVSGGVRYGLYVGGGLIVMTVVAVATHLIAAD
jgi:uncharacterized membrane protein (DUF4010 family)